MGKLDGKIALITGGSHGMGAADAELLAPEGANVIIGDVLDDEGTALAESIRGVYKRLDVTNEKNWAEVDANIGHIDILVNNAGVVAFTPVATTELSEWNRVIEINLTACSLASVRWWAR